MMTMILIMMMTTTAKRDREICQGSFSKADRQIHGGEEEKEKLNFHLEHFSWLSLGQNETRGWPDSETAFHFLVEHTPARAGFQSSVRNEMKLCMFTYECNMSLSRRKAGRYFANQNMNLCKRLGKGRRSSTVLRNKCPILSYQSFLFSFRSICKLMDFPGSIFNCILLHIHL